MSALSSSFLALHSGGLQFARAMQLDLGVLELHFEVGDLRARGIAVSDGGFEGALCVGIIERRKDLALLYVHAFIEEYAGDAPRNFRGDRGAAARRDVPAGVQQGRAAGRGFLRDGYFDDGLLIAKGQAAPAISARTTSTTTTMPQRLPRLPVLRWVSINAQRAEIGFGGCDDMDMYG